MKKILSVLLCSACVLTSVGYDAKGGFVASSPVVSASVNASELRVWAARSTEKIIQGVDYSDRYGDKTLRLHAFRNEEESGQIILSPKVDIASYEIRINDLKNSAGDTLSADSFEVYNQKYILVSTIKELGAGSSVGYYPDALLPYEKAVEYGENTVKAGQNQGLWIVLRPKKEQAAGVYSGSFTLTAGGNTYEVPVSAEVYDYTLSDVTHSKSSFMVKAEEIALGELNSTEEMYVKYYEYLLDHRINPQQLPGNGLDYTKLEGERLERFLDYAEQYAQDPRCSSFNIPFDIISTSIVKEGGEIKYILSVDFEMFENTLRAMAERSRTTGVNLIKKAATYFIFFDEYDLNGLEDTANYNMKKAYETTEGLAEALRLEGYDEEICAAVAAIKHKCVGSARDGLPGGKAQMVPVIEHYNSEEQREKFIGYDEQSFGENGERWWYTCENPHYPSPTYHIDDHLISSRLLSWMMYDYGVVGNLYWDAALYAWREPVSSGTSFGNEQLQNYYGTALRYPSANGDGFLLYPGRQYGIDGPVGSVRLQSILDGNEDYDLMYALEELYAAQGVSEERIDGVMDMLYRGLYSGVHVAYSDTLLQTFDNNRALLADLLVSAKNVGFVVESFERTNGKGSVEFSAPVGATVTVDGKAATGTTVGERTKYALRKDLSESVNTVLVQIVLDGKTESVTLNLGGRSVAYEGSVLEGKATFLPTGSGEGSVGEIGGEIAFNLLFAETAVDRKTVNFDVSTLGITSRTQSVTLRVYVTEGMTVELLRQSQSGSYNLVIERQLVAGWNEITLTGANLNLTSGTLKVLRLNIKGRTQETALSIGGIQIEE